MSAAADYESLLRDLRARLPGWTGPLSLVSFTIAGIQEFLAAARTTRDVWNGSYLLSILGADACLAMMGEAARRLPSAGAPVSRGALAHAVLIPDVSSQPLYQRAEGNHVDPDALGIASFPNTILMVVPGSGECARAVATAGVRAVADAWDAIATSCRDPFSSQLTEFAAREWDYQTRTDRVFEPYWTAVEVPGDAADLQAMVDAYRLNDSESEDHASTTVSDADADAGGHGLHHPGAKGMSPFGLLMRWSSRVLSGRKMVRDIQQIGQEGPRCSLCGARSALADYKVTDRGRDDRPGDKVEFSHKVLRTYWDDVRTCPGLLYRFRPGERLCAVCIVRRLAPYYAFAQREIPNVEFPSTSSLATAQAVSDLLTHAQQHKEVIPAVQAFGEAVRRGFEELDASLPPAPSLPYFDAHFKKSDAWNALENIDGDYYYPEAYFPRSLAEELGVPARTDDVEKIFKDNPVKAMKKRLTDPALGSARFSFQPSNYFAVIAVDGDHMGDWISGTNSGPSFNPDWQSDLSGRLARFAAALCSSLELGMPGKIVYAGGDDLLAFVPRERVIDAFLAIDQAWQTTVAHPPGRGAIAISISMACVIARHNDPLSGVIEQVHALLKDEAKQRYGREAFVLHRTTGGAEPVGTRIRQASNIEGAKSVELLDLLNKIYQAMLGQVQDKELGLSARIVCRLGELSEGLREWTGAGAELHQARRAMLSRLVKRHSHVRGVPSGDQDDHAASPPSVVSLQNNVVSLYDGLVLWAAERANDAKNPQVVGDPLDVLLELLAMLRFLTREGR